MGSYWYTVIQIALIFFLLPTGQPSSSGPKRWQSSCETTVALFPGRPGAGGRASRKGYGTHHLLRQRSAAIAVIPMVVARSMNINRISAYLSSTGLLITVSVWLDLVQRIESNLVAKLGFLGGSSRIKGAYA